MYEQNAVTLDAVCAERSVIRHVSKHRNPDGTMDIAGNLKIWNDAPLPVLTRCFCGKTALPATTAGTPLQPQPSLVFCTCTRAGAPPGYCDCGPRRRLLHPDRLRGLPCSPIFLQRAGFNTAILTYRLKPYSRYDALADMQRAVRLLRFRKKTSWVSPIALRLWDFPPVECWAATAPPILTSVTQMQLTLWSG